MERKGDDDYRERMIKRFKGVTGPRPPRTYLDQLTELYPSQEKPQFPEETTQSLLRHHLEKLRRQS